MIWTVFAVFLGCVSGETNVQKTRPEVIEVAAAPEKIGIHEGIQHPPIPADSPAWRHDPGGFVPDFRFYGERSWDDVRMRVAGHIGVIERDRARLAAKTGDFGTAAWIYESLASEMERLLNRMEGDSREIPTMIRDAAQRDAKRLRARISGLSTETTTRSKQDKVPDISDFRDFDDRHKMRMSLWSLYLAAADPVHPDTVWGYFDKAAFHQMLEQKKTIKSGACRHWNCMPKGGGKGFTVEGIGGMPTGDTLIDVGGEPGPKAIGRLEKLSLDDPKHRQWVEDTVYVLNARMKTSPGALVSLIKSRVDQLNSFKHGSRYYNIKQMRNEGVRVLARAGHYDLARQILAMNFPLHHQDWECPNREGILVALDGRLAALQGDKMASGRLAEARALSDAFLKQIDTAEQKPR